MGLDMYLEGRTFHWKWGKDRETRDGFPIKSHILELGYWRKHPDLHGFIVQEFAKGNDDQRAIPLNGMDIIKILDAVKADKLPHTEGFFFGQSTPDRKKETVEIFEKALKWLQGATPPVDRPPEPMAGGLGSIVEVKAEDFADASESREVFYQASW